MDQLLITSLGMYACWLALLDSDTFIVFEQDDFEQAGAKLTVRGKIGLIGGLYKE